MRKTLFLMSLIFISLIMAPIMAQGLTYGGEKIKDQYRQNETLEIVATIENLRNITLTVDSFNITIIRSKPTGRPGPVFTILINISRKLVQYEGFTVRYSLKLKNFPPDEYNLTAYFNVFFAGEKEEYYVYKNVKFRLLPAIEIPPIVYVVMGIMASIIVLYIGYGIAMKIRG